ncbi:MAG: hypothetical protein Q7R35_08620 [Elusimicrobiota bacterium]|nr:hypothetical protein [Elusimicrobiota bacterium]
MGKKQQFWPAVAVGPAIIFIIQRGNNGFAGAGGGNNKVFEALAVFALYLERFKDTRLVGVGRNVEEDSRACRTASPRN